MRLLTLFSSLVVLMAPQVLPAQTSQQEFDDLVRQYQASRHRYSPATQREMDARIASLRASINRSQKVGTLSANPYLPGSTSSPASQYQATSPSNPYGKYGSKYSNDGAQNPYA